jgi:hypothetical protein
MFDTVFFSNIPGRDTKTVTFPRTVVKEKVRFGASGFRGGAETTSELGSERIELAIGFGGSSSTFSCCS